MNIGCELTQEGYFICDIADAEEVLTVALWTFDQAIQSAVTPRYVGFAVEVGTRRAYGGQWVDEGAPSADEVDAALVAALLAELNSECDRRLELLKAAYPESEVLSWDKQEAEANAGGGPLVAALAVARGIDQAELISRILQKAQVFAVLSGTIIGQRQALEDQIKAGARAVSWPAEPGAV